MRGSSIAGCTLPCVSTAREVIVCSPGAAFGQSTDQKVHANLPCSLLVDRRRAPWSAVDLHFDARDRRAPRGADDAVLTVLARHLGRRRLYSITYPRPKSRRLLFLVVFNFPDRDVVVRHQESLIAAVQYLDPGQPLDVRDPVPARRDEPEGVAIRGAKRLTIDLVGEKRFAIVLSASSMDMLRAKCSGNRHLSVGSFSGCPSRSPDTTSIPVSAITPASFSMSASDVPAQVALPMPLVNHGKP